MASQPPNQDKFDSAFSTSHDFRPQPASWGMFSYSDAPPPVCGSGMGTFQWFRTKKQLIAFIHDYMAWFHPGPSSMEAEEIAANVQKIVSGFDVETGKLETLVKRLNKFMSGLWQIEWVGQFRDLTEGNGRFAVRIRTDFLESLDPDAVIPKRPPAITRKQLKEFKEYLQQYGF